MMSQFVIHRGLIISVIQAIFSSVFYSSPVALFSGMLIFGYSCWYTMFPVFCLIVDRDISKKSAILYPELYEEIRRGRALSNKTFTIWCLITFYQAIIIFLLSLMLTSDFNLVDFISLSFTALIFVELCNLIIVVKSYKFIFVVSIIATFAIYPPCMILLPGYYRMYFPFPVFPFSLIPSQIPLFSPIQYQFSSLLLSFPWDIGGNTYYKTN